VSSRDFPGPSWPDRSTPDDGLPEYRPADAGAYDPRSGGSDPDPYGRSRSAPSRHSEPRNSEPRNSEPRHGEPRQSEPRHGRPRYENGYQPAEGRGGPGNGQGGAPGYGDNGRRYPGDGPGQRVNPGDGYGRRAGNGYSDSGYSDSGYQGSGRPAPRPGGYRPDAPRPDAPRPDAPRPDGYRPDGYRPNSYDPNGYDPGRAGSAGRPGYDGGSGYGRSNGRGPAPGRGPVPDRGPVPGRGPVNGGYVPEPGAAPALDDSGAWFRPTRRKDTGGFRAWKETTGSFRAWRETGGFRAQGRRSARPGYYTPDDDLTGLGRGPVAYAPGSRNGFVGPDAPARPDRGPAHRPGRVSPRGPVEPDDDPQSPVRRFLLRIWRGSWWRRWTIKKAALLLGALAAGMALVLIAAFFVTLNSTKVPLTALSAPLNQSSLVYFSNGKVVGCFCSADRTVLTETQIRQTNMKPLVAAVVAAEDRNFFTEGGVSVTGIMRAAKADLTGNSLEGASTITEQFVKTYYDPSGLGNLTVSEKLKEIFVSIKLARVEPKWWILTHYLNAISLGHGANGVQAAAQTYFGRNAWQLTDAQAAMIAALIQSPYGYEATDPTYIPPGLPNSLLDRWIYVLTNMVRDNAITQQQFNALVPDPADPSSDLKNFPKVTIHSPDSGWPGYRGYIMQLVADELNAYYGEPASLTALGGLGLQIHTTINQKLMNELYSAVNQEKQEMADLGQPMPSYVNISAVLEKPGTGDILAFYGGPGYGIKHCSYFHCEDNTILDAEPVGSSFKPYVLATAVSQGMNAQNSVMDSHSPLCIPPDWNTADQLQLAQQTANCTGEGYWQFNESTENYKQNLTPWQATAVSNDPAYEDLIHRTTVQSVINMAQSLGVSQADVTGLNDLFGNTCPQVTHNHCFSGSVTAALGEGNLSAVDQANTFSDFVSGGWSVTPHVIGSIVQSDGAPIPLKVVKTRPLSAADAGDVDYALSYDTSAIPGVGDGTGVPNAVWNRPMIAKTGTLGNGDSSGEAWFVGAIPQYSMSVGMFVTKPNGNPPQILDVLPTIGGWTGGYGGAWPATIWHTFMSENFNNLAVEPLPAQNYAGFSKWIMALPPKKAKKTCEQPGQGHHHNWPFGQGKGNAQCGPNPHPHPTGSPSPNPTPSGSPSPTPSGSPSPTPSGSPTPSHSPFSPFPGQGLPQAPDPASDMADLTVVATLPPELPRLTAWAATSGLA